MNGFYSLELQYWKRPCNDSFWQETRYDDIEVSFFRHFRFFKEKYLCLYCLDTSRPVEIQPLLALGHSLPKRVFMGRYFVEKGRVYVAVDLKYAVQLFELVISGDNFSRIHLVQHLTLPRDYGKRLASGLRIDCNLSVPGEAEGGGDVPRYVASSSYH